MGKTNFTEGKWFPQVSSFGITSVTDEEGHEIISWTGFDGLDIPLKEKKANAYLIASSPEMYEEIEREYSALLWEIQNFIVEDEDDEKKLRILQVVVDRKANILAKARGEKV